MGDWRTQIFRFGVTGLLNTVVDYGVFNFLVAVSGIHSGLAVGLMNMVAVSLAATHSFYWNRNWTFRVKEENDRWSGVKFVIATGLSMIINSLVVMAVSGLVNRVTVSPFFILNGGKLLGAACSVFWNFITYRYWVFRSPSREDGFSDEKEVPGLVSLIIPAFNEEERLPRRLGYLAQTLPGQFPVEIVVVDDGSTDGTRAAVTEVAGQFPWVRCLGYPVNRGKGEAVRTGMKAARGEYLIFSDADESFTEDHIKDIARCLFGGGPVAIAVRQSLPGGRLEGELPWRRLCGRVFNLLVQALVLPGFQDTQCGLKGFHRNAASQVFKRQRLRGFAFDVELLALARGLGFNIVQVPVQARDCPGSRVSRITTPLQMGWDVIRLKIILVTNGYGLPGGTRQLREVLTGVALVFTALAVRIPYLWHVPRYIDELKEVNLAYLIYQGQVLPLHNAAHDIGAMHNYVLAIIFKILGPGIYWPRLYVALTSALTVLLVYRLGVMLYGRGVGLVAAGLLLTNGMHILVTHMAWANSTTPFFFTLALMASINAKQKRNGRWLVAAALLWAAALQTHSSVVIYVLVVALYVLRPGFRRETGIGGKWYGAAALTFLLGYANMIYYNLVSHGGSFRWMGRKTYAIETAPGLLAFGRNLEQMLIELMRSVSSTYTGYPGLEDYLLHPGFMAALGLLMIGSFVAVRKGKSLPLWMIVGGFAVIPWVNQRYVFFLSTRYIMPVIICALLVMALGLVQVLTTVYRRLGESKTARSLTVTGLIVVIALQLVPHYAYCARLMGTNQSNSMTLEVYSTIQRLCAGQNTVVLLDEKLPLENNPLPDILALSCQPFLVLSPGQLQAGAEEGILQMYSRHKMVAVLTDQAYQRLKSLNLMGSANRLSSNVIFPLPEVGERTIYIVEIRNVGFGSKPGG